ncbi:MAG: response regulator [Thermodesulfobacteriota bacterium]
MKKVLIVDDSEELLVPLSIGLEDYKDRFEVVTAMNGEEAVKILQAEPVDVLVTDLYMPKMDGIELLVYANRHHSQLPCVVMTAFGSPDVETVMEHLGVFYFLEKPFDLEALVEIIGGALDQAAQDAKFSGLSVAGFMQLIQMEHKSCVLVAFHSTGGKGSFFFVDGELYAAECGELSGNDAAIEMINWEGSSLNLDELKDEDIEANVTLGLKSLILEAARTKDAKPAPEGKEGEVKKDEKGEAKKPVGVQGEDSGKDGDFLEAYDLLRRAILLAEGAKNEKALPILAAFLKKNPRIAEGWLWYSRLSKNMKIIGASLKNASLLSKDDPEVREELIKLQKARDAGCMETDTVGKCPFCWMPMKEEGERCPHCAAVLRIPEKQGGKGPEPDGKVMANAVHRFTKTVLVHRNNDKAHYYLGLALFNLGNWDEAIDQFYKTKKIKPDDGFYQQQLKALLDNIAATEVSTSTQKIDKEKDEAQLSTRPGNTIMVVEDSATTRKVIKMILTQEGYDVVEAINGIDALARLNEVTPDLVLLDIIMPDMDGYEVLAAMRKSKTYKKLPVIMLTAKDGLVDKVRGKMSGSNEYLTKPFKPEMLMEKVGKYMGKG